MVKVSLAVICLNEEKKITRCLNSVEFAAEKIVLDSGSHDQTRDLAKQAGAKVTQEEWRGFQKQKQRAVDLCSNDWILSLDADESLSPELAAEILVWLKSDKLHEVDGFEMPRRSFHLGRWINHGGWYPDRQLRLFHRARARWEGGEHLHERVKAARVVRLKNDILHWPFDSLQEQIETNNRYSSLGADEQVRKGGNFSLAKLLIKPCSKFVECYIIKGGFRDGLPGFIIAVGAAYSVFLKWSKLWETKSDR